MSSESVTCLNWCILLQCTIQLSLLTKHQQLRLCNPFQTARYQVNPIFFHETGKEMTVASDFGQSCAELISKFPWYQQIPAYFLAYSAPFLCTAIYLSVTPSQNWDQGVYWPQSIPGQLKILQMLKHPLEAFQFANSFSIVIFSLKKVNRWPLLQITELQQEGFVSLSQNLDFSAW